MRSASHKVANRITITHQPNRLLAMQPRTFHKVQKLVATEVTLRLGVVNLCRFSHTNVDKVTVHQSFSTQGNHVMPGLPVTAQGRFGPFLTNLPRRKSGKRREGT